MLKNLFLVLIAVILPFIDTAQIKMNIVSFSFIFLITGLAAGWHLPVLITAAVMDILEPQAFPFWTLTIGSVILILRLLEWGEFFVSAPARRLIVSGAGAAFGLFLAMVLFTIHRSGIFWLLSLERLGVALIGGYAVYGLMYWRQKQNKTAYAVE